MANVNPSVTYFTICNSAYFPGLVGLINSLRLTGHHDPIIVANCGLNEEQCEILRPHCQVFDLPKDRVINPQQYKPFAHLLDPKGIVVIIDCDMIITKSLADVIKAAADGGICAFPDPEADRWYAEWQAIFALKQEPRHQTYACTALIAFSTSRWPDLLEKWWVACERIFTHPTNQEGATGPTSQSDQDAFNALMMSDYPPETLVLLPKHGMVFTWEFGSVHVVDPGTLKCTFRGLEPSILHACLGWKPWQLLGVQRRIYQNLLRRLATSPDVEMKVPPALLPVWMRPSPWGGLVYRSLSMVNTSLNLGRRIRSRVTRLLGPKRAVAAKSVASH